MKVIFLSLVVSILASFNGLQNSKPDEREQINKMLDSWHKAAADSNFDVYFGMMTEDAIYIGTDPTENWNLSAFKAFAKPYFDKGQAWNFKLHGQRHIYFDKIRKMAWFDELLDTQMKICRGSGVLEKVGKQWKIKHYVLSMTIPNDNIDEVVKIITPIEDNLLQMKNTK